jgi:hypothetical protein
VTFSPTNASVSSGCQQRNVPFGDKVYKEWTIRCYAQRDGEPVTFHLSQGYGYNEIFAFEEDDTGLRVHHYGHRVGLMKEKPTDNFGLVDDDAEQVDETDSSPEQATEERDNYYSEEAAEERDHYHSEDYSDSDDY